MFDGIFLMLMNIKMKEFLLLVRLKQFKKNEQGVFKKHKL